MITQSIKNIWCIHQYPYPLNHTHIHWNTEFKILGEWHIFGLWEESGAPRGKSLWKRWERPNSTQKGIQIMCNCGLTHMEVFPSSYANSHEGAGTCKTRNIYQQLLDSGANYIWLLALHFRTLQICFLLTEGRWWWVVWTDSLTLALWLWLCSGEPREWPEAAPTKCSPDVKDSPGICLNPYFNQISMYKTPFCWLFC